MSEQTSNPTSGQNVPKSKFRRKSQQEQTAASKLRMEKRGEKLDAAREKLAKQKPPKKARCGQAPCPYCRTRRPRLCAWQAL